MITFKKMIPEWYTPESEKKEKTPCRFLLKPLTPKEHGQAVDMIRGGLVGTASLTGGVTSELMFYVVKKALQGWENVTGDDGKPLEFNEKTFDEIPFDLITEISTEVMIRAKPNNDELKNS